MIFELHLKALYYLHAAGGRRYSYTFLVVSLKFSDVAPSQPRNANFSLPRASNYCGKQSSKIGSTIYETIFTWVNLSRSVMDVLAFHFSVLRINHQFLFYYLTLNIPPWSQSMAFSRLSLKSKYAQGHFESHRMFVTKTALSSHLPLLVYYRGQPSGRLQSLSSRSFLEYPSLN